MVIILKVLRILTKTVFFICLLFIVLIFSTVVYLDMNIDNEFKIKKGSELKLETFIPVTAEYEGTTLSGKSNLESIGHEFEVDLKIFGIIPLSTVNVQVVDELQVAVLGEPFGMKLYTEGVLVIDLTEVKTDEGTKKPAQDAGIKKGDYIISVNGSEIFSNEDLSFIVENSDGREMEFKIKRGGNTMKYTVKAVISSETDSYKIGIWIRDSSAGIGTLTFYSPATDVICGLGHGICDEDTGELLNVNSGELVDAEIIAVEKGVIGGPGQLKGKFGYSSYGDIDLNCGLGVYSRLEAKIQIDELIEVALKQEVTDGAAQVLCTVNGTEPKLYDCNIKLRASALHSDTQNMIVTITDEELLETTGGIVQGMSGSPILQDGKIVGAVTHVLVNDPTRGYGIFIENMLETANQVAEEQALKDAS